MKKLLFIVLLFATGCNATLRDIPHDQANNDWKWAAVMSRQMPVQGVGEKTLEVAKQALNECKGTYVTDKELYGEDKWTTPNEYIANGKKGDCEDFAICVYYELRASGFEEKDLKFIVGNFNNGSHLALDITIDGKHYIADVNYNYLIHAKDYYDKVFKMSIALD